MGKRLEVFVGQRVWRRVVRVARRRGRSAKKLAMSVMRRALEEWVEREDHGGE